MAVRRRALDRQRLVEVDELAPGQDRADRLDLARLQRGDVAERLVLDLAVLAVGAPQQRGLIGLALVVTTREGNMDSPSALGHDLIMPHPADKLKHY